MSDTFGTVDVPVYRYYTADLVTGEVVMEIPFQGVSWERKISAVGQFSGNIGANTSDSETDHFALYDSTLPGKYALYVMRDDVCVWGGIIWSREYDITTKVLSITATEFVSYLHHRVFWKSVTTDQYQASFNSGPGTDSDTVKDFITKLIQMVNADQDENSITGVDSNDYLAYLASDVHIRVNSYSVTSLVATITTEEPHKFAVGDPIRIYVYNSTLDIVGVKTVTGVLNDRQFTIDTSLADTAGQMVFSGIEATYAILESTHQLLQTAADVNLEISVDDKLADYYTDATGDSNPFTFRGSEMRYVGEILQNFASNGVPCKENPYSDTSPVISVRFDYFVECSFDTSTRKFRNVFRAWYINKDIIDPVVDETPVPDLNALYGPSELGANNLVFEHPGNIVALNLQESADSASTRTWLVDSGNDMGDVASKYYGAYTNLKYLSAGYPILETASTDRNLYVNSDEEVLPYAKQYSYRLAPPVGTFSVTVNGGITPTVGTYAPGDWCVVIPNDAFINQRLKFPYENRNNLLVRKIKSMRVNVPDNPAFPETVELELVPEWLVGSEA